MNTHNPTNENPTTFFELFTNKQKTLGLTKKELTDALSFTTEEERNLPRWLTNTNSPPQEIIEKVERFAQHTPYTSQLNTQFTFVDLFAGIGGFRLPAQLLGGQCVFTSEWDKFAQKTYRTNFGETPKGDITKIDEKLIPHHDLLMAGFPCQPFSQAGKRLGFADTRGTLFFDIERVIRHAQPASFLLENVQQLVTHDKGRTMHTIKTNLTKAGYIVHHQVLNAKNFGVPQNRKRVYIVGFHTKTTHTTPLDEFTYPTASTREIHHTRVGEILEHETSEKYTLSDKLWEGHQRRKAEHERKGNGFGYTLVTPETPHTNTLSARYYKDGSEILVWQKNRNPRKLTPRECARLQGFPEDYIIPVSNMQAYKQFGNSVAIPVVHEMIKAILIKIGKN